MPFLCEPIVETQFASLKDVDGWISANEDRLERVPIRAEQAEYEGSIIGFIPKTFAGKYAARVFNSPYRKNATMFDFINIFTEYAQTQPIHKRLEMEERAGVLADQIVKNKRKFGS
jgi:hypothetical protein